MYNFLVLCWIVIVTGRFFATSIKIVPQEMTYIDFLAYPFVFLSVIWMFRSKEKNLMVMCLFFFLALVFISLLINNQNTSIGLSLLYLFGILGGPFTASYLQYATTIHGKRTEIIGKALSIVLYINILIFVFLNIPTFLSSKNPDVVSGTFGFQGAYYFVVLIGVLLGYMLGLYMNRQISPRKYMFLFIFWVLVFLLAQFRAGAIGFLFCVVISLIIIFKNSLVSQKTKRNLWNLVISFVLLYIFVFPSFEQKAESIYKQNKYDDIIRLLSTPEIILSAPKFQQALFVYKLYSDYPYTLLLGLGPGSIMSRGFQMSREAMDIRNTPINKPKAAHDIIWKYVLNEHPLDMRWQKKYAPMFDTRQEAWLMGRGGSYVTEVPFASIYSIMMETGLISILLILAVYIISASKMWRLSKMFIHRGDGIGTGFSIGALFGLIQILSIIWADNYLEVQFITYPTWFLVGMAFMRSNVIRSRIKSKEGFSSITTKHTVDSNEAILRLNEA